MPDTMEVYSELVKERTSYCANPFTLTNIAVGDILVEEDGILQSAGINIKDKFGYDFKTIQHPYRGNMGFSTQGVKSTVSKTLAEGYGMKFNIDVNFSEDSQVFFQIEDAHVVSIADKISLGDEILRWYEEDKFPKEWRVVTEVVYAGMTTIAMSEDNTSSYNIAFNMSPVEGAVPLPIQSPVNFDFKTDVGEVNKNKLTYEMSQEYSAPLLHMLKVDKLLFFKPHIAMHNVLDYFRDTNKDKVQEILLKLKEQELKPLAGQVISKTEKRTSSDLGETLEKIKVIEI